MKEHSRSDDPEVIERELQETRARVDRTIDQIQHRLSPGQLLDEGLRYFRSGPSGYLSTFGTNLSHSVRDNPLPVAMVGLGLAWLAFGQRSDGQLRHWGSYQRVWRGDGGEAPAESSAERARAVAARLQRRADESTEAFEHRRQQAMANALDVKERAGESTAALRQRVAAAMDEASARWEEMKASIRRRSNDMRDSAAGRMAHAKDALGGSWETAGRASGRTVEIFERQPLLAAAAGVTVGAVLGSLLPSTRRESEVLGPQRDELMRQGEALGRQAVETAKDAARAAKEAALHEVDRATIGRSDKQQEPEAANARGSAAAGDAGHHSADSGPRAQ